MTDESLEHAGESDAPQREERRSRLTMGDDIRVTIPPTGISRSQWHQMGAALLGAAASLIAGLAFFHVQFLGAILLLGALLFAGFGCYVALSSALNVTELHISADGLSVTNKFPIEHQDRISADRLQGVYIGPPGLIDRGYFCHDCGPDRAHIVARGEDRTLHFGQGLPASEQQWIKEMIEDTIDLSEREPLPEETALVQPPERFYADLSRYAGYSAIAALVLFVAMFAVESHRAVLITAVILGTFAITVAALAYRAYRMEHIASGWHRAVVKSLATLMGRRFSASDEEGVARELPDFPFFGGPRQYYNVAWNPSNPEGLIGFDFTSHSFFGLRDGVACALDVRRLSHETISLKPRLRYGMNWLRQGIQLPQEPEFSQVYFISADNEARARSLLSGTVATAIAGWHGQGPAPWVCMCGGMVGFSIWRRYAGNDRMMREFYDYARRVRRAIEQRLTDLRQGAE